MISAQQPAYFSGYVKNTKGKLIKDAKVEVLTKNESRLEVKDGNFWFEFAKDGRPVAVTIAYQAKGYKTQMRYYEILPGVRMENYTVILDRGRDNEAEVEDLYMMRANNGIRPREDEQGLKNSQ